MSKTPSPPQSATEGPSIAGRFQRLAAEWKQESRHLSNPAQMAVLKPYQRIIGMGQPVVPLITEELRLEPDHWFRAMEAITGEDPVPTDAKGNVRLMAQAGMRWGELRDGGGEGK